MGGCPGLIPSLLLHARVVASILWNLHENFDPPRLSEGGCRISTRPHLRLLGIPRWLGSLSPGARMWAPRRRQSAWFGSSVIGPATCTQTPDDGDASGSRRDLSSQRRLAEVCREAWSSGTTGAP